MEKIKFVPCRGGKLCNEKDSPKVNKGLAQWKSIRSNKEPKIDDHIPYWQQVSSCSIL